MSSSPLVARALRARLADGLSLGPFTDLLMTGRGRVNARGSLARLHSTTECRSQPAPWPDLDQVGRVELCPECAPLTRTALPSTGFEREALARAAWWQVLECYGEAVGTQLRLAEAELALATGAEPTEDDVVRFARLGAGLGAPGSVGRWHRSGLWFTRYSQVVFAASFAGLYASARLGAAQVLTEARDLLDELDTRFEALRRQWPSVPSNRQPGNPAPVWAVYRPRDVKLDTNFADQLEVTGDGPDLAAAMTALAAAKVLAVRDELTLLETTQEGAATVAAVLGVTLAVCPRPAPASTEVAATALAALTGRPSNEELAELLAAAATAVS